MFYGKMQNIYIYIPNLFPNWRKILTAFIPSYQNHRNFYSFTKRIFMHIYSHSQPVKRFAIPPRKSWRSKITASPACHKRCCFPFFVFNLRHFYSLSRAHKHAEANRPTSLTPGNSLLLSHPPRRLLLRSAEWPKVGEPLLAAHAINSKASRFYWMDLARPPRSSSHQLLYILITTPGVDRRKGARGVPLYRPGQLYYCSFINFRFSLMMLPRAGFTLPSRLGDWMSNAI